MPLIVLSGQPCSGKSTVAATLQQLLQPSHPVHVVDEPSLHLERNAAYQSEYGVSLHQKQLLHACWRSMSAYRPHTVVMDMQQLLLMKGTSASRPNMHAICLHTPHLFNFRYWH